MMKWCVFAVVAAVNDRGARADEASNGQQQVQQSGQRQPAKFAFQHYFGDADLGPGANWGQTALVDLDRDGDLDFVTGMREGDIYWYEYVAADQWKRHRLGRESPSDVGGVAFDVNGDGWIDHVSGGAWYKNSGNPRSLEFQRYLFDAALSAVHDIIAGDIDGDGREDVVTMSDQNDLRWYAIPSEPTGPWLARRIYEAVHSGISLGNLDKDGDLDIVRSDIWLENKNHGEEWVPHRLSDPWGDHSFPWSYNATQTRIGDLNGDGRPDIVICDGEIRGARIAWLAAPSNPRANDWRLKYLPTGDDDARGAYHSLQLADFDLDGDLDIFSCEMEHIRGDRPPRWFIWENTGGKGTFVERVILDVNLGGHAALVGDVDQDGDIDICGKPWSANPANSNRGLIHFDYLENLTINRPVVTGAQTRSLKP